MSGQRAGIDPHTPFLRAERNELRGDRLADTDTAGLGLDEELGDHSEARPVPQHLQLDRRVSDDDPVDGAHDHTGVIPRQQAAKRLVERLRARITQLPQRAASHDTQLCPQGTGELDDRGNVFGGRCARCFHRAPLPAHSAGELFDLAENRPALPVRVLVRVHRVELLASEPGEPLHDL